MFKLINSLPRVIFIRMSFIVASGDISTRLDELMSTYNTIHDMLSSTSDSPSGVSFWQGGIRHTVTSLYHHPTARFSRNHKLLRRKCAELNSLLLYYMGDIKEMDDKILETVDRKVPAVGATTETSGELGEDNRWIQGERNKYQHWFSAGTHFVAVATEERPELQGIYMSSLMIYAI